VSSPTLFTYGEHLKAFAKGGVMGEAGPEAIMPLTRDGAGRLGVSAEGAIQPCINNIYIETPAGYTAEQKSRVANDNGGEDIMFTIVKQTAKNVTTPGSPMFNAMKNTFGASQVLTSR
jgi:phage-related minor tail protein